MCERLILENFDNRDIWATFTYTEEPETLEEAVRNMQNFIKRLNYKRKKMGLKNARYVYTTECGSKGRFHHHIVMDGDLDMDTVEATWNKGKRNHLRRLQKDENGLVGAARYITKEKERKSKYQKTWNASTGLRKPKEKVNHYKTKQYHVNRIVKGNLKICDHLTKWYGDMYEFAEAEVKYNTCLTMRYTRILPKHEPQSSRGDVPKETASGDLRDDKKDPSRTVRGREGL